MTQPTPAADELQAALSWDTPPTVCPICTRPLIEHFDTIGSLIADYECGQTLRKDKEADSYSLSPVRTCRNWAIAAVAQRQRADALESERDALRLMTRADQARADTEYAARVRLTQDYDLLDKRTEVLQAEKDKYALGWVNAERAALEAVKRADTLAAQVAALTAILRRIRQWDMLDATSDGPFWKAELDAALLPAPGTLAGLRGSVPDDGVPSEVAIANLRAEWDALEEGM